MLLDQAILLSHRLPDDLIKCIGKYTINQEINGKKEGIWKEWCQYGQLKFENHFKEDKLHGISKGWVNGQLLYENHWKEGVRVA